MKDSIVLAGLIQINARIGRAAMVAIMFRHPLVRDLARLSIAKLAILALLYALFFSPSHRAPVDPALRIGGSAAPSVSPR